MDNVEERDTDFAIIQSFVKYEEVRNLFFNKIKNNGEILKIYHSLSQDEGDGHTGESDIVIILQNEKGKFAIFIEDKIAADPQPNQRERYDTRATFLSDKDHFSKHYIFLCAPKKYLDTAKADGYQFTLSHEDIWSVLDDEDINKAIFKMSFDEKKQGGCTVKNNEITEFWHKLHAYVKEKYFEVLFNKPGDAKGNRSDWFTFETCVKQLYIVWKTTKNSVNLEFTGMANKGDIVNSILKSLNINDEHLEVTGKSVSLRLFYSSKDEISVRKPFEEQIEKIDHCMEKVVYLNKIAKKIKSQNVLKFPVDKI